MRPAPRSTPTAGHRLAGTLIALLAVLLAWVPADAARAASAPVPAASAPAPAASAPVLDPAPAATGAERPDTGPHADDPYAIGCAAQARVRHDHLGERPCPPDHHATDPPDADAGPAVGTRASAPSACAPVSPGRSAHDRGRAPPAPAGI